MPLQQSLEHSLLTARQKWVFVGRRFCLSIIEPIGHLMSDCLSILAMCLIRHPGRHQCRQYFLFRIRRIICLQGDAIAPNSTSEGPCLYKSDRPVTMVTLWKRLASLLDSRTVLRRAIAWCFVGSIWYLIQFLALSIVDGSSQSCWIGVYPIRHGNVLLIVVATFSQTRALPSGN
ncbi:MAG: hypothetical protein P1V13_21180 [Rhizobiaceae bacterium]|nr:hypothetical protein [Rhizobiaceae bacterium]